jgi:histidinol-phosphate aminotransferase
MQPNPVVAREAAYKVSRHGAPIDLKLDGNEGVAPPASLLAELTDPELMRRYPDARALEKKLAERVGVEPDQVIVTCGADDALDRACRALLWPGREVIIPVPTFEMLPRYAALTGASQREVPWPTGAYPVEQVLAQVNACTAAIAAVSPNNPTGAIITREDLARVAEGAPDVALLVDLAYAEYTTEDLTGFASTLPNAIVFRTLSKAWGLAGLRVGYAIARPEVIGWLRATGHPYANASPSLALASAWLDRGEAHMHQAVSRARSERQLLRAKLAERGVEALPSQANFVLCRPRDATWLRDGLAGLGIAVRIWPKHPKLDGLVRITCPADDSSFARLCASIDTVLAPEALVLTLGALLDERGDMSWTQASLQRLAARLPLALVSDQPRAVVERTFAPQRLGELFRTAVCAEDRSPGTGGRARAACEKLGVERAWLIADDARDISRARSTGLVPLGLSNPLDEPAADDAEDLVPRHDSRVTRLTEAGAARVISSLAELETILP